MEPKDATATTPISTRKPELLIQYDTADADEYCMEDEDEDEPGCPSISSMPTTTNNSSNGDDINTNNNNNANIKINTNTNTNTNTNIPSFSPSRLVVFRQGYQQSKDDF